MSTFLYSQYGSEFEPSYTLRHLDPEQHASKNRYAAALYDAFSPEVLFAEVLLIPEWTQPAPSSEQSRANGAVPPPPEPVLPSQFSIQLYNPDQQIVLRHKPAGFTTAASWEFEMPQQTFRAPSASALDRGQHDPAASEVTPKIGFKWKKDGKFSKDLACFLSGKSTDIDGKTKHKEPDITVAILKSLKELTLYEPNLRRVDIEDLKGFEVVLLLSAMVIRDVYFGSLKDTFNITTTGRKSNPTSPISGPPVIPNTSSRPQPGSPPPTNAIRDPRVPPTDPRSQWELDAETARLKQQAEEEERVLRRRREEEERMTKKLLETEDQEQQRRRRAQIDAETEQLKLLYGREDASARPAIPPRIPRDTRQQRHHSDSRQSAYQQSQQAQSSQASFPSSWGGPSGPSGPYMSGAAAQSSFLSPNPQQPALKQKSSIFNFRRRSDHDANKLSRKKSAVF